MEMIFSFLTNMLMSATNYLNEITHGNQMMSGFLATGVMGAVMYACRSTPLKTWQWVKRNTTIHMEINTYDNCVIYTHMLSTISKKVSSFGNKNLSLELYGQYDSRVTEEKKIELIKKKWTLFAVPVLGLGVSWFFYKRRLVIVRQWRSEPGSQGGSVVYFISLTTFGKNTKWFNVFLDEINESINVISEKRRIHRWQHGSWYAEANDVFIPVTEKSLALNKEYIGPLVDKVIKFKDSAAEYDKLGLPHKLTVGLHGDPGTGKTSLVKYLATKLKADIYIIDLQNMSPKELTASFGNVPPGNIVLLEDIDSSEAVLKRTTAVEADKEDKMKLSLSSLTTTDVLNMFDGVRSIKGLVTIYTTNHFDKLDPAFKREGRTDLSFELPKLDSDVIKEHFEGLYDGLDELMEGSDYPVLRGCEINSVKLNAMTDVHEVARLLKQRSVSNTL